MQSPAPAETDAWSALCMKIVHDDGNLSGPNAAEVDDTVDAWPADGL